MGREPVIQNNTRCIACVLRGGRGSHACAYAHASVSRKKPRRKRAQEQRVRSGNFVVIRLRTQIILELSFAYVDFASPGTKETAITFSEKNLDGRRLLIKDGAVEHFVLMIYSDMIAQAMISPEGQKPRQQKTLSRLTHPMLNQDIQKQRRKSFPHKSNLQSLVYF